MITEVDPSLVGPPWRRPLRGHLDELAVSSDALRGNPLGDPCVRPLLVYTPPGGEEPARALPSIYLLQGFTGQVDMWRNRSAFRATVIELIDEVFADPVVPPCLVVLPDCWTSLGGSQFLDSPGTGRYHTHLCDELVPFIDSRYRTLAEPAHRAVAGKSSGGYGAMVTALLRPELFGALATHAGDALFEVCYWRDVIDAVRTLRDRYDGSFPRFLAQVARQGSGVQPGDHPLLNLWAMASAYSTDADGTVRLPFDTRTGRVVPEVWERWLAWDPVRMVPRRAAAVRSWRSVYIDAGDRDEYGLDLAAEAFRAAISAAGAANVRFELFSGGHSGIDHRHPLALRHLAAHIGGASGG